MPIVDTLEDIVRDPESYRILVPIANPRTEAQLVELACTLGSAREAGRVHVVHIVQAPKHHSLESNGKQQERILQESDRLLEDLQEIGDGYDVAFETSTIVSPRSFEEIFDRARRTRPDLVLMGWGEDQLWSTARAERPLEELTNRLPSDFLVVKDRGLDPSRILLPTAGGPDSELSAEIAHALSSVVDAEITLLHVVDSPDDQATGEQFLANWTDAHDLENVNFVVDDSGDIEEAIKREAENHTMIMIGATEKGLLSRLIKESLHIDVVNEVDCSVLLAERPSQRSFRQRLFGDGARGRTHIQEYQQIEDVAAEPETPPSEE